MQLDANQLNRILRSEASLALVRQPYTEIYHVSDEPDVHLLCGLPAGGPWPEDYIEGASAEVCYVCWFVLQKADKVFADVEAFYAADERRRYSGEAAYGAHWRATGSWEQSTTPR